MTLAADPEWLLPTSLEDALRLRSDYGEEATVVAGGTYIGILVNHGLLAPSAFLSLGKVPRLDYIEANGSLRLGAMTRHRTVERSSLVRDRWPALAQAFSLVASPRVRNQATVGGVLADADYASDPPAILTAMGAEVVVRSPHTKRIVPVAEFITGYYETALRSDELLIEVRVPGGIERAVYRKFRSRSAEDRPCVAVAAVRVAGCLRVVVGAVTDRPQMFPAICDPYSDRPCDREAAVDIGRRYAEAIEPIDDARGSASYRRRVIAVEVRRALEELDRD